MGKLTRASIIKNQPNKQNTKVTIDELIQLAEENIDRCELEVAYKYAKQALDFDSTNTDALETMASIQMEMGNNESAKKIYQKMIDLKPNEGFSKYMCMAQLSSELEAVNFYNKGIELMIAEYEKIDKNSSNAAPGTSSNFEDEDDDLQAVTKGDISTAYGSIAEIYLTDLCMEENADNLCKNYLDKSLEYDPKNPESLQLLSSYWLSKEEIEKARQSILESVNNWLPQYTEAAENDLLVDPTQVVSLTYDSRINTTRILTEVEEFDTALTVLEQLIEEDDEVVVIWYMLGWVNYCKGDEYFSNAKYYLKRANAMALKIKYEQKYLDQELRNHITELLEKLSNVESDDEEELENKENMNEDDEEFETDSEEEAEAEAALLKNGSEPNGLNKEKKKLTDANNNIVDEPMDT